MRILLVRCVGVLMNIITNIMYLDLIFADL